VTGDFPVVVLAAGASARMGRSKPLLDFDGRTAIDLVLDACRDGGAGEAIVVLGSGADRIRDAIAAREGVRIVVNDRPERGQTSSARAGVEAVSAAADGFFILPVDHPLIEGQDLAILTERFGRRRPGASILVPVFEGRRGHPLLLAASHREALGALADDRPLREFVRGLESEVELIPAANAGVVMGMNTEEEYRAALVEYRRRRQRR